MREDFLKKRKSAKTATPDAIYAYRSATDETSYSCLYTLLALKKFEGETRELGSISLFAEQGRLKACVSDKDNGQVAFITLEELDTAFQEIEEALQNDSLTWREMKQKKK